MFTNSKNGGGLTNKAFTLIELLAVIIILAVIALIATPIVLNVVEEAKKQANKNSVYGIMDSAKLYYTESLLDSSKSSNINGVTNLIDEIKVSGKKPDSGVLYINEDGKIAIALVYDNVCYKKNFTENNLTESEDTSNCTLNIEPPKACSVTQGTGANIGDIITCGTESFYIYDTTGNNIKMLAMYNLEIGNSTNSSYPATIETYIQSSKAIGYNEKGIFKYATVAFSSDNKKGTNYSDYSGSIIEEYVDIYKTILEDMGVNVVDASIITKEELETLGCTENSYTCLNSSYPWVYSTSYWTGSNNGTNNIWRVRSVGIFDFDAYSYNTTLGVRPTVTIPKNSVEGYIEPQKACSVTQGTGANIGDIITCGTESFYVYDTTGSNIKMLAMYNLEVGNSTNSSYPATVETNKQSSNAIGWNNKGITKYATIKFSSTNSSYSGSIIEEYVNAYKVILEGMGVNVIDTSLITKGEIEQLVNGGMNLENGNNIKDAANELNRSWIYSTSYWFDSAYSNNKVYYLNSNGSFSYAGCTRDNDFGVRPVITISKSDL